MGTDDNFPTVIGRPVFDTMPCPRPGDFTGKDEAGNPVRVSANGRAAFPFPGGAVPVPEPTRAALLLSAKQWLQSLKEELQDNGSFDMDIAGRAALSPRAHAAMYGKLDRLDAVLAELAAMEAK